MGPTLGRKLKQECALECEAAQAYGRLSDTEIPVGCTRVNIRPLPYPFTNFFTITSDCDAPTLEKFLNLGSVIRERYGLPISDSYFPSWLYARGRSCAATPEAKLRVPAFDVRSFIEANGRWMRAYHMGWFDTVHGWAQRLLVKVTDPFELQPSTNLPGTEPIPGSKNSLRAVMRILRRRLGLEKAPVGPPTRHMHFRAPSGWQQHEPPRFLVMRLRLPLSNSYFRLIGRVDGEAVFEINSSTDVFGSTMVSSDYVVDLWELMGTDPKPLHKLSVIVELHGSEEALLEVKNAALLSDVRASVIAQCVAMERFNIRSSVFTSHGIGVLFGVRGMLDNSATDPRCLADVAENPHYCVDLIRQHGVDFLNSFSNTCVYEPKLLCDLIFPNTFANGEPYYDFFRYAWIPQEPDGTLDFEPFKRNGVVRNHSLSDCLGLQIRKALEQLHMVRETGVLLYTHAAVKDESPQNPGDYSVKNILDENAHMALAELRDRYLNLSGTVANENRVFVAPTSVLLRMSQVNQELRHRAWYDPHRNTVFIERWMDTVLKREFPEPDRRGADLRGLCLYVNDSHAARLHVAGTEITHLIRNPPDDTSRASISVGDISAPKIIIGGAPLKLGRHVVTSDGLAINESVTSQEPRCMRRKLTLERERGQVEIELVGVDLSNAEYLGIAFRKYKPSILWALELVMVSGMTVGITEAPDLLGDTTLRISPWESDEPRWVIMPFYRLLEAVNPTQRRPIVGPVATLRFALSGQVADALDLENVWLLRDREQPSEKDGFILAGAIGAWDIREIRMIYDGHVYRAKPTAERVYFFETRVPVGTIVDVSGVLENGQIVEPVAGRFVEVLSDTVDIDF